MESQKHLFSLDPELHYLNCAYKGPLLKSSENAAIAALVRSRNPISISQEDFFTGAQEVKTRFAELVKCDATQVALIPSSSYGFATALKNIPYQKGKHAIVMKDEFPSGYFAAKNWCDAHGTELKIIGPDNDSVKQGESWNRNFLESINSSTAIVLMSAIHWMNGVKFDLEKIGQRCKEVGAIFIVDGTQLVGAAEMDVNLYHIDALICPGYKWLFGPYGMGIAYFGKAFDSGKPLEESWLNRKGADDFSSLTEYEANYMPGAGRYNVGEKSNFILIPMFNEALKQINLWKVSEIEKYCHELTIPLYGYLKDQHIETEEYQFTSQHLFGLKTPAHLDQEWLKNNLKDNKVSISNRGSYLRISVNVFNTSEDIDALIRVFEMSNFSK